MRSQYNIINHSILPLVYRLILPTPTPSKINYILKDPQTKSLILFNPKPCLNSYTWMLDHIKSIQQQSQCKLSHIVANTPIKNIQQLPFFKLNPSIKFFMPGSNEALRPQIVGELSICFIAANGYHPEYNLIGVTHMTQNSTKLPCLFVDELIGVNTIDFQSEVKESDYLRTLDVVKYFPNETFIFPDKLVNRDDLLFSKALFSAIAPEDSVTALISQKLAQFQKVRGQSVDCLLPTSILEQKSMNPFLNSTKFQKLFDSQSNTGQKKDRNKCFGILRAMRRQWKPQ